LTVCVAGISLASPVLLAPMAGITDLPFRRLVARFGAGLVVSEMVASQEMVQAKPSARARAELGFGEAATAVQLAGRDPYWLAEAARMAAANGARIIDLNMGCPAKRVTSGSGAGACGAALMRDEPLALRLVAAVVAAVQVPVTLKCRLGWDDGSRNAAALAARAVGAGVRMVTVHGRTRAQFYDGSADWAAIRPVAEAVAAQGPGVPVIANGDIRDAGSAAAARAAAGAAGVMVGRAARGRPWLLAQIAAGLAGRPVPAAPEGAALADLVAGHHAEILGFYGSALGMRIARKHLGWYLDAAGDPAALRGRLLTAQTPAEVAAILPDAFGPAASGREAA
jgi:tRNA-dihydrouridine synthase B